MKMIQNADRLQRDANSDADLIFKRQERNDYEAQRTQGTATCISYLCSNCASLSPVISQCCAGIDDVAKIVCIQEGLEGGLGSGGAQSSQLRTNTTLGTD